MCCTTFQPIHHRSGNRPCVEFSSLDVSPKTPRMQARSANKTSSAMANVPISGALAENYGYLSLSVFTGTSLLLGGVLLSAARVAQNKQLAAIV